MEDWQNGGFGLYLHWPFCQSKCPYCDFNSHVAASIDQTRWQKAYLAEIDRVGAETQGRVLNTVFFGGGTPSLMEPEVVPAILERVRATWTIANERLRSRLGACSVRRKFGERGRNALFAALFVRHSLPSSRKRVKPDCPRGLCARCPRPGAS